MLKENFGIQIEDLTIKIEAVEDQQKQLVATLEKISTIFIFILGILIALSTGTFLSVLEINENVLQLTEKINDTNLSFKNLLELSKSNLENNNSNANSNWLRAGLLCLISCLPCKGFAELIANSNSSSNFLTNTLGNAGSITKAIASVLGICQGIIYRISKKETSESSIFGAIYDPAEFQS